MSPSWAKLWSTIPIWTSVQWGVILTIVTVLCVTLTWTHVVVVVRVSIVETGLSLMELDCHSLVLFIWVVQLR